jgi:hypothetical protein
VNVARRVRPVTVGTRTAIQLPISEHLVRADDRQRLNVGRLGARGLDELLELPKFGETRDGIFHTVIHRYKRNERFAVGEQQLRVANAFGLCRIEGPEHLLRHRLNIRDAFADDLDLRHLHAHV